MLNNKQKAYLRKLAQSENAIFQIGKDALSDNLIDTVNKALAKRELIKVSVLKTAPADLEEIAFDLAMHTKSEVVQMIGRTIVLYKKAKKPGIILP